MRKVKHLLVVDDDSAARYLAAEAIQEAHIAENIIFCEHGRQALAYVLENCLPTIEHPNRQCPELILLDINMPVMNGMEFLEELASLEELKHTHTSVILLSSAQYHKEKSRLDRFTILGYIEKPVTSEKLVNLVKHTY
ncbi:response regulator [Rhodocytophaga aerolata]|uniref:Response regulator n=1 Tax=Rhodocytophaga aerolata TaxID=455078 RepID=A0ABT8RIL0_9BACT|nr:response regulator [Rhodocytophaga aerolata]MDO1451541.1 response regulator [Rhodocytophaga aerolata]